MSFDKFEENIINIYGDAGITWLASLLTLCDKLANKLSLRELRPVDNLSYNYVMTGFQGNKPIILKLGLDIERLKHEAEILKIFLGAGAVKVLAEEQGMLLLQRIMPGIPLKSYFPTKEYEAIEVASYVIKQLHATPILDKSQFAHVRDWLQNLDKDWPMPNIYLKKARKIRNDLLRTSTQEILLHGDLHHDNILRSNESQWQVIDPKGVIGDPVYEVVAFIRNPIPELLEHTDAHAIINNRIERFAKALDFPKSRIQAWCYVQAILSWIWTIEDNGDEQYFKHLTKFFDECTNGNFNVR